MAATPFQAFCGAEICFDLRGFLRQVLTANFQLYFVGEFSPLLSAFFFPLWFPDSGGLYEPRYF
jgi:hypothetical protein